MKVRTWLLSLLCFSAINSNAQTTDAEETSKYSFNYTKIIPGMPENASLGAYGNVSVSTAKGLPDIQFTFYTLSKGGVDIPISIAYDASGIKYSDVPSCVGMKWSLNAGGSVNRSVNGIVDEDYLIDNLAGADSAWIAYQNDHISSHGTQDTAKLVSKNDYDFLLDDYSYNFPGHSGEMYLGPDQKFRADKEFSKLLINAATHLDSFYIKDDMGNTYIFGSYTDNSTVYPMGIYNKQSRSSFYARVAWKLKRIITATKQVINFEYSSYDYSYQTLNSENYTVYLTSGGGTMGVCNYSYGSNEASFATTRFVNTANLLTKISTDDQEVYFTYQNTGQYIFTQKLSSVKVYSKISADTVKQINLSYNGDFLAGFTEKANLPTIAEKPYYFDYNSSVAFDTFSLARDVYGYYNGQVYNNSLIDNPPFISSYYLTAVASRAVNSGATQGVLKEITYPTGGKTQFTYENNIETIPGVGTYYSPGVRVKSIWDLDVTGKVYNKKLFHYTGLASAMSYADLTIVTADPFTLSPSMVNVYFSDRKDMEFASNYYYGNVLVEKIGNDESDKHIFEKDYYDQQQGLHSIAPLLIRKDIFLNDTSHLQKTTLYDYQRVNVEGVSSFSYTLRQPIPYLGYYYYDSAPSPGIYCPPFNIYQGYDTRAILKPRLWNLVTVTDKEYATVGDSLITVKSNSYKTNSATLLQSETTGADAVTTTVKYYYPEDYPGNSTLAAMKDSFITAPVVKEQYLFNNAAKKEKETNYAFYSPGFFAVNNQVSRDVPTSKTQTFNYYAYNLKAQLLSRGRSNDIITSYIWDYLDEQPVAEVTGADTSSIAYSSFEADGKGRWNFSGTPAADSTAVTGKKDYALSGGNVTRSGLNSSTVYIVSYWSKNSSALTITGTQSPWPKTLATIVIRGQTWKLYEHRVTGQSTITVSGSTTIDELRLYPQTAQMTSYTYQPLVGVTSQSDINGRITYYEYDGLERLVLVRDQYRNVLKRVCYNYLGQQEECPGTVFWNKAFSSLVTKSCGAGYIGTKVVYSVPAGIASSTVSQHAADSIALIDFNTNALNYANANGSCIPIYYNVLKSGSFTPDCDSGYITIDVTYTVFANTYSSLMSQAYVDSVAQADVDANGQAYANANGNCVMFCPHCVGASHKCINFECETGIKVYTSSVYDPLLNRNICTYHYEFSDGSWSEDQTETSLMECMFS